MRFSSFTYLVGQGLHNLRANRLMTFASMGVLTVCMLLIGAAYLLGVNIDAMVEYIGDQNETVVYMDQGASDDQIAAADTAIRSTEHVVGVTYMSPQDVLAVYSDMLSSYTNLQDAFANDNPFYPNYRVVVDSPDNIEAVSQQLRQIDGVYQVNAPLEMSKVFVSLQKIVSYACYGIVLVLAIVSAAWTILYRVAYVVLNIATFGLAGGILGAVNTLVSLVLLVLLVLGLVNAVQGQEKPLPLIGGIVIYR